MTWSAPSTKSTSTLITAAIWNQDVVANTTYLGNSHDHMTNIGAGDGGALFARLFCTVRNSIAQTISTGTDTWLLFDTDVSDDNAMHSTSSYTSRITVPISGKYLAWQSTTFDYATGGYRMWWFCKNGNQISNRYQQAPVMTEWGDACEITMPLVLAAYDYIELRVIHTRGSDLNIQSSDARPQFGLWLLGI